MSRRVRRLSNWDPRKSPVENRVGPSDCSCWSTGPLGLTDWCSTARWYDKGTLPCTSSIHLRRDSLWEEADGDLSGHETWNIKGVRVKVKENRTRLISSSTGRTGGRDRGWVVRVQGSWESLRREGRGARPRPRPHHPPVRLPPDVPVVDEPTETFGVRSSTDDLREQSPT